MTTVLQLGSRGPYVAVVQVILNVFATASELPPLEVDGIFGMRMREKLIECSRKHPFCNAADGKLGPIGLFTRAWFRVFIWKLRLDQWRAKRRGVTGFSYEF
jgi:hypothetical protein